MSSHQGHFMTINVNFACTYIHKNFVDRNLLSEEELTVLVTI